MTVFSHGLSVSRLCQNSSSAGRSVLLGRKLPEIRFRLFQSHEKTPQGSLIATLLTLFAIKISGTKNTLSCKECERKY
ncbi:hypothetical protein CN884_00880 [Ochrobactrum sp. 30A/1000/2015]|nr:hypothetical protein CN884_00880 [Ochrobactrum sp. 30A/1000/2015]PJT38420.1 hypothetical protein CN883_11495 [Ochrobactrum sp. 27A/999/2015]PJT44439.1 hypothetical protein CN882_00880 [Ochrobactrum sp. 23A/997/2015]